MLITAAILLVLIGFIHSILGERYILSRLFKRDNLPQLFGSDWFTKQTLRFAWHLTTIAWWGFAAILLALSPALQSQLASNVQNVLLIIATVFFISGLIALVFSKAKHVSWLVFFTVAALCYLASIS